MSEPRRLRDDASDDVRALLRAVPPSRSMSAAEVDRSRARLAGAVTAAAVAGGLSWFSGAAFGAGLGVVVGVASLFAPPWFAQEPPAPSAVPASVAVAPPSTLAPAPAQATSTPEPSVSPVRAPTPGIVGASTGAPSAAPSSSVDALAEEAALLDRARAALGTPASALRITEEHASRFPRGKLGMEREMIAIEALRRLGRGAESRARAESLLARAKGSLYEDRLRKMLEAQ
ncbi:MAG: hypothetical protein U0441_34275 [Polyangiaceae bacterium]